MNGNFASPSRNNAVITSKANNKSGLNKAHELEIEIPTGWIGKHFEIKQRESVLKRFKNDILPDSVFRLSLAQTLFWAKI